MPIDCETARENMDAHALGALDADETGAFEAHIRSCADCARLLDEARDAAASLALAAPFEPASASLKARVMASAAVLSTAKPRGRPVSRWWMAAAAALALVATGGVAWGAWMQRAANDLRGQRSEAQARATQSAQELASVAAWQDGMLTISAQPDVRTTAMTGTMLAPSAHGTYLWSSTKQQGALLATGLPPLPAGESYVFWFVYGGNTWENAGTCAVSGDQARLIVRPLEDSGNEGPPRGFALTVEPSGGAAERQGAMVLRSAFN